MVGCNCPIEVSNYLAVLIAIMFLSAISPLYAVNCQYTETIMTVPTPLQIINQQHVLLSQSSCFISSGCKQADQFEIFNPESFPIEVKVQYTLWGVQKEETIVVPANRKQMITSGTYSDGHDRASFGITDIQLNYLTKLNPVSTIVCKKCPTGSDSQCVDDWKTADSDMQCGSGRRRVDKVCIPSDSPLYFAGDSICNADLGENLTNSPSDCNTNAIAIAAQGTRSQNPPAQKESQLDMGALIWNNPVLIAGIIILIFVFIFRRSESSVTIGAPYRSSPIERDIGLPSEKPYSPPKYPENDLGDSDTQLDEGNILEEVEVVDEYPIDDSEDEEIEPVVHQNPRFMRNVVNDPIRNVVNTEFDQRALGGMRKRIFPEEQHEQHRPPLRSSGLPKVVGSDFDRNMLKGMRKRIFR